MMNRGRGYSQTSEWDMREDYNDSLYDTREESNSSLDHCRLYITNIPKGLNDEGLRSAFSKFGTLIETYLSRDPNKKYGLVRYETPGEAKLAMMKMNKTEPLKLHINVAYKGKKVEDRHRKKYQDRSNNGQDWQSNNDDSFGSKSRNTSRVHETTTGTTNGDNMDDLLKDEYGFSESLDPELTMELESIKLEQLKLREEQLICKHRLILLKQKESRQVPTTTMSNRCILPDGKIVVRNVVDKNADLDVSHSAGAGDSRVPALQRLRSNSCVVCGARADTFCARCGVTPYCSPRCQGRDWNERHRDVCHNLARLSGDADVSVPAVDSGPGPRNQNPAPLRRPHAATVENNRERLQKRDDDAHSGTSDKSNKSLARLQNIGQRQLSPSHRAGVGRGAIQPKGSPRRSNLNQPENVPTQVFNNSQDDDKPTPTIKREPRAQPKQTAKQSGQTVASQVVQSVAKSIVQPAAEHVVQPVADVKKTSSPTPVAMAKNALTNNDQVRKESQSPALKPASVSAVTPTRKLVPKNYVVEQLAIGETMMLSVEATASDCRATTGDYICVAMHEDYATQYNLLCDEYGVDCEQDADDVRPTPYETCSFYNKYDGGWYRARCITPTTLALIDSCKIVSVTPNAKIRKLPSKYEAVPEFCCTLECKDAKIDTQLRCVLLAKDGETYKVSIEELESGKSLGEGTVSRWLTAIEQPAASNVIPEVPRPLLHNNSTVLLVDVPSMGWAFVRPADMNQQRAYDDVVQNVLLAGLQATTTLQSPPQRGQTIIVKHTDGAHYRALCKRTNVAQSKYLIELIDFGDSIILYDLSTMYPCPPHLDLSAVPCSVSKVKLSADDKQLSEPAKEYVDLIMKREDEITLTLPADLPSAPSGSEATLKLAKNSENINSKIKDMCTPDWKKLEEKGCDVIELKPIMYKDLEEVELSPGPLDVLVLDVSVLQGAMFSGCPQHHTEVPQVFKNLSDKMAKYCESELGREPYLPAVEEMCIARCPSVSPDEWYRAVVLQATPGKPVLQLCFVDYGNIEEVPVNLVRKMLPEFVHEVPFVTANFELEGFPESLDDEQLARAISFIQYNEEGVGRLSVRVLERTDPFVYKAEAPDLLAAVLA
ncbi:vreteno isoform X3 [Anticarsia gemmatalis]|uniref:vreteno isoform X3 n=1 Tax=Anticarsia gemmatalis TaxID=129554 RepID=UPI003F763602